MTMKGAWKGECFTLGCTTTGAMGMSIFSPAGGEPILRFTERQSGEAAAALAAEAMRAWRRLTENPLPT